MGGSAAGGGTNALKPGSPYLGGTTLDKTTYTGPGLPTSLSKFNPPSGQFPTPTPGSAPLAPGAGSHPLAGLWTGMLLGSLLSQALSTAGGSGGGGPMGGGMMPSGAPSAFSAGGFTPGLRGIGGVGSIAQSGAQSGGASGGGR